MERELSRNLNVFFIALGNIVKQNIVYQWWICAIDLQL